MRTPTLVDAQRKDSIHKVTKKNTNSVRDWCFASFVAALAVIVVGCRESPPQNNEPWPEIIVAAAANLTDAFEELSRDFTRQTGIRVILSFGSTADLAKQIENGAPFDVFASADTAHVDALHQKGILTSGTRRIYARGTLVLWFPPGNPLNLTRLEDLTRPEIERIAVAKPDIAPYGEAAVETMQALKIWEQVEPKVVYGMNVSQVRQFVSSGNAEAGFLPRALVKPGEGSYLEVDEDLHRPIDQALAVVKSSANQDAAQRFVDYVIGPEGQKLLANYGYQTAE